MLQNILKNLADNISKIKVDGDLWYHLDTLDEEDTGVLVLEDAIKWSDEELAQVKRWG